jgi:hypothetical protein
MVAFCGQLFPFIRMSFSVNNGYTSKYIEEYHYSPENIKTENIHQKQIIYRFFNEPYHHVLKEYMDKHPIVVVHKDYQEDRIVINDNLSKINFQKVIDPFTAFNQIQNFLNNIAQPRKSIPEISDLDKIQSHGFDKFSFRKDPTNK